MSKVEDRVIQKIATRAQVGKEKYGVTMEREDLTRLDWLIHAQEESMDMAVYLQKLIDDYEEAKKRSIPDHKRSEEENLQYNRGYNDGARAAADDILSSI